MPAALAALTCGSMVLGSIPEMRSTMSTLLRIAKSMPCTHWLGCPWFSHSVTLSPRSAPTRFIRSMMPFRNGLALELGMDSIDLPLAQALASKGAPGARKMGAAS